jgi:hypothetical protein
MRWIAIIALALAGCAGRTPEPVIRTVEVKVPVDDPACARAAVKRLGPAPVYPDNPEAIRNASGLFERVQLLLASREMRKAREAALKVALEACAGD